MSEVIALLAFVVWMLREKEFEIRWFGLRIASKGSRKK